MLVPKIRGFYVEPTNICTLKCSGCARTRFINQWPQHWKNHSLDINELLNFLDCDLTHVPISLNGNYGDPIYHPDLIQFVQKLKNRGAVIQITTNGSYKKAEWWQELVALFDANDTVQFSVDGTPENFKQYRVNADWESIEEGMRICGASKCHTIWKFIPFKFNQDDIEYVRELSQTLGIKEFLVKFSDRFDEQTQDLIPDPTLLRDRYTSMIQWKQNQKINGVAPSCKSGLMHFISADGFYSPCCWSNDYRFYYKTIFGKNKNQFSIKNNTISSLIPHADIANFFQEIENHPVCQYNCPKINS